MEFCLESLPFLFLAGGFLKKVAKAVAPVASAVGGFLGGPAGAAIGGIASSALGVWGQQQTNKANASQAEQNLQWQEYMSNTAHQRQVEDLRAAGLNPILSANSGAAVGRGAQAEMINAYGDLAANVNDAQRVKQERELNAATIAKLKEDASTSAADTDLRREQIETEKFNRNMSKIDRDIALQSLQLQMQQALYERKLWNAQSVNLLAQAESTKNTTAGNPFAMLGKFMRGGNPIKRVTDFGNKIVQGMINRAGNSAKYMID